MLHKFRVQYILIDFSDNGFLVVFQRILFRFPIWSVCGKISAIVVLSDVRRSVGRACEACQEEEKFLIL